MRKLLLILALFAGAPFAVGNNNGVGLWLSNYGWGFDLKHFNTPSNVWDIYLGGGLGFSDRGWASIGLDAGYYWLINNAIKADASMGKFPVHYGPNAGFGFWTDGDRNDRNRNNHLVIAPNFAVGISWFPHTSFKWDMSLELFPGLRIYHNSIENSSSTKWDSETKLGLGMDARLLVHVYIF